MKHTTISEEVLGVLSRAVISGRTVQLTEQLPRDLYVQTNKALEGLGGKWTRKVKAHVFEEDAEGRLADAISTGTYQRPQDIGFFPTPVELADDLIQTANIGPEMDCLEPSAGSGRIAEALVRRVGKSHVWTIERDLEKCAKLHKEGYLVDCGDFLAMDFTRKWDRIVMNPPFANQQDIDHVMHAYLWCLKHGGKLVSVMSAGTTFRQTAKAKEFRALVDTHGYINTLPEDAFKESGTGVRTIVVVLDKP
ncbi:MAG: hypothetical protein R3B95_11680 [Nitrospirales bacterium]|nr:hypothetical protein [Nitrospirales bacterium]